MSISHLMGTLRIKASVFYSSQHPQLLAHCLTHPCVATRETGHYPQFTDGIVNRSAEA